MAGDWIKMRHNLETDPDVLRIAAHVGVDRFSVDGRLHMIWAWADQHSIDGCAISATTSFLDELVCCAGFCKALRSVGWLDGRDWELSFPNFSKHNGETAKKRAQAQKTMSKKRGKRATNVAQSAQPEKRREEKNIHTHSHSHSDENLVSQIDAPDPGWESEWARWIESWEGRTGKRFDPIQAQIQLDDLKSRKVGKAQRDLAFSLQKYSKNILDSDHDFADRQPGKSAKPKGRLRI